MRSRNKTVPKGLNGGPRQAILETTSVLQGLDPLAPKQPYEASGELSMPFGTGGQVTYTPDIPEPRKEDVLEALCKANGHLRQFLGRTVT